MQRPIPKVRRAIGRFAQMRGFPARKRHGDVFVGDVLTVGGTTLRAMGAVVIDTIDTQAKEFHEGANPLSVPSGQVIVYGYHVNSVSS